MRRKGKELGADDQLAKPEIGRLVIMMDKLLKEYEERDEKIMTGSFLSLESSLISFVRR